MLSNKKELFDMHGIFLNYYVFSFLFLKISPRSIELITHYYSLAWLSLGIGIVI